MARTRESALWFIAWTFYPWSLSTIVANYWCRHRLTLCGMSIHINVFSNGLPNLEVFQEFLLPSFKLNCVLLTTVESINSRKPESNRCKYHKLSSHLLHRVIPINSSSDHRVHSLCGWLQTKRCQLSQWQCILIDVCSVTQCLHGWGCPLIFYCLIRNGVPYTGILSTWFELLSIWMLQTLQMMYLTWYFQGWSLKHHIGVYMVNSKYA